MSLYLAHLTNVVDGDTIDCTVNRRHRLRSDERIRIAGIDAPDRKKTKEKQYWRIARAYLRTLFGASPNIKLIDWGDDEDAFGRWLCTVIRCDGLDIGAEMIRRGYAVPYEHRHKIDWEAVDVYPLEEPWYDTRRKSTISD